MEISHLHQTMEALVLVLGRAILASKFETIRPTTAKISNEYYTISLILRQYVHVNGVAAVFCVHMK